MSRPVARYRPSRRYLFLVLAAVIGAMLALWAGVRWSPHDWRVISLIASGGFAFTAAVIVALVLRPAIEIHETHLQLGRRIIPWNEIHRVDQTGWVAPLVTRLTLDTAETVLVIHAGDLESCTSLLRHLRRYSRQALLDGIPYLQFWGEPAAPVRPALEGRTAEVKALPPPRYPLLRPEDEDEVERLFQRLKTVGRLDRHSPDEKAGE